MCAASKSGSGQKKNNAPLCLGLLAHVDAGKTTLAESLLYLTGSIRRWGRVDHGDAFLDTYELERSRGITIFSKQAVFPLGERTVTLLDTPGHVDFSAEMERTLQVLDAAVLVISGADGVQGHVSTLWRLLARYRIPTFLFVNKMDQPGTDAGALLRELQSELSEACISFDPGQPAEELQENIAMCGEAALEIYLETGRIPDAEIRGMVQKRQIFPCYFGSALRREGVEELLAGLGKYAPRPSYTSEFAARVYKISRDEQGNRLTHMKVLGGSLAVKAPLSGGHGEGAWQEKADQIRIYSGDSFQLVSEAPAGTVCTVTGLSRTQAGEGLGAAAGSQGPMLTPVLTYRVELPEGCDLAAMFRNLCQLEEEEPQLHVVWEEETQEIRAQVMGEVQLEVLQRMIGERYGIQVTFGTGSIIYKETIAAPVEGVGHFEPLRHYAEVHLLLEPGEPGSGLIFSSSCSEDVLDKNWQRLILTHLEEKRHRGVLTGAEITDMRITLLTGRAHPKHTEGGDFRQATYRAVRQGLREAESVLLEPVYRFRLEVPADRLGRAMADIQRMQGSFSPAETTGNRALLTGTAPASEMEGYQTEVTAYTRGQGQLTYSLQGYEPCHNAEEVIAAAGYDPEADPGNPTGSVFCAHGAGYLVNWDEVKQHMHVESGYRPPADGGAENTSNSAPAGRNSAPASAVRGSSFAEDKELEAIFKRTYGESSRSKPGPKGASYFQDAPRASGRGSISRTKKEDPEEEYLLVDGYNIIFSWEELQDLARVSIEGARELLADILSNYQGYKKMNLILVYDAYKVKGNLGAVTKHDQIYVVYTKEAETADQYIEKTAHRLAGRHRVTVATSDALEQVIILGAGAMRMSAPELKAEIESAGAEIRELCRQRKESARNYLFDSLSEDLAAFMEEVRLGRASFGDNQSERDGGKHE